MQTNPANQPAYAATGANGKPSIHFAEEGQFLNLTNFMTGRSQAEMFVVLQAATNYPAQPRQPWEFGASITHPCYPNSDGTILDDFGSTNTRTVVPPTSLAQWHLYDVAAGNTEWSARLDGGLLSTSTNSFAPSASPTIGALSNSFAGDMAEVLVFNRILTSQEREEVSGYLNQKYALLTNTAAPANVRATAISPNQVSLVWDSTGGPISTVFQVERKAGDSGAYAVIGTVRDTTSFVDSGLWPQTQYSYRIQSVTFAGSSGYSDEAAVTTLEDGTPLPLGDLKLWLRADAGVVLAGSNVVTAWQDQSGNTNDAVALSDAPLLANGAMSNGRPSVRFDASGSFLSLPTCLSNLSQAEAFVVLRARVGVPSGARGLWQFGASGAPVLYPDATGALADDFGSTTLQILGTPIHPIDQYHAYNVVTATNGWTARINGQLQFTRSDNTPAFTNLFYLGKSAGTDKFFDGDIAELLVFARALTGLERDAVGRYLNQKYSFTTNLPAAPTGLTLAVLDPSSVQLSWTRGSTNETAVQVERQIGDGVFIPLAVVPGDDMTYTDSGLTGNLLYSYRVKARNYAGDSGYSNVVTRPPDTTRDQGTGDSSGPATTGDNAIINLLLYTPLK